MAQEAKATTTRTTFSRETAINTTINAAPATVWRLLTTAEDYSRWNSTVISVTGEISLGKTISLVSKLDPKRVFKLRVKTFDVDRQLIWGDNQGQRVYTITNNGNGTLNFSMVERIGGFLFPLFASYIPSFDESFEQFAADLKREAESVTPAS